MPASPAPPTPTPVSFPEFAPATAADWLAQLRRELKGRDPVSLHWALPEGLTLEPFYGPEALAALPGGPPPPLPPRPAPALNVVALSVPAGEDGRLQIERGADALSRGADGLHFIFGGDAAGFLVKTLAERLPLGATWLGYTVAHAPDALLARLGAAAAGQPLRGFLRFVPGIVPEGAELGVFRTALRECVRLAKPWPEFRALTVNGVFWGNRGGTLTQQLAFSLNTAAALLVELPDADDDKNNDDKNNETAAITVADVAAALHLDVAVGPSYFPEMARLRATRRLWATLLHGFGLPAEGAHTLPILALTSTWTQTTLDPHTNLLRHTTEAMSALLGGADAVQIAPFDCLYEAPNELSARLARNLPLLLRDEAHLDWVADPAAGSYFLETLTDALARAAWAEFQALEALGGLPAARGWALEAVSQAGLDKFKRIATGQDVVIGTNRFQNPKEQFDFEPKKLLRSREFDTTRATYPSEVLRLATALHFERRARQEQHATLVLLGDAQVNADIAAAFWHLLHPDQPGTHPPTPPVPADAYSVFFSTPEAAMLMYATPGQFEQVARVIQQVPEGGAFEVPALLASDQATLEEAVRVFGFREFVVEGHHTEDVLARLQGR